MQIKVITNVRGTWIRRWWTWWSTAWAESSSGFRHGSTSVIG